MKFGALDFEDISESPELVAAPTLEAVARHELSGVLVAAIDATLADTAAFCEAYDVGMDVSANCVIVEAKRADKVWYAACLVLAVDKADINGVVRRHLEARKISFAPMETAISLTGMEYGGITPIGLPEDWPLIIDVGVMQKERVIIGSGIRGSKILVASGQLAKLPGADIVCILNNFG